jgi:hypothetical protein
MVTGQGRTNGDTPSAGGPIVVPDFVLLLSIPFGQPFAGFDAHPPDIEPLPPERVRAWTMWRAEIETSILGKTFIEARRIKRWPLGRVALGGRSDDRRLPTHAEVFLLTHIAGVALWEAWLPGPEQAFAPELWIDWLDPQAEDGVFARVWRGLIGSN